VLALIPLCLLRSRRMQREFLLKKRISTEASFLSSVIIVQDSLTLDNIGIASVLQIHIFLSREIVMVR
jgi:hypothetical protein